MNRLSMLSLLVIVLLGSAIAQEVRVRTRSGSFGIPEQKEIIVPKDVTPPTIEILEPADFVKRGMKVSGGPAVVTTASSLVLRGLAKDSSGIARVLINGEEIPFKPTAHSAEFTSTPLLVLGDNEIVIKAVDRFGNEGILTLPVRRQEEQVGGNNFALLIAIDQYDQWPRLVNPMNDARTVAEELIKSYGFTTEVLDNADRDYILSTLRRYAEKKYGENDQLLIFFAGHGQFDEVLGDGYLVARDSKLRDDIKTSYISHSNLRTVVNSIPCRHIFLVVDACFGGTFDPLIAANLRGEDEYKEVTKTEFIERKLKFKTRRYLTSGGKEYVPDGRPGQHSPFTRRFLEAFRSYGGRDGILTMNEILSFVEKVKPEPRAGEFGGNEPGSDFVFIAR